jgi:trehalose-phosphatase
VAAIVERHGAPHVRSGRLRLMHGAEIRELLPNVGWDKGSAVRWIAEHVEAQHGPAFVLYVGDDVTDEDAFRAVRGSGLAVAASDRTSGADVRIDGPAAVERLLDALR